MNIKRAFRFWWQRRTRGWDDSVTWNLEAELARWIAPRLRRFNEVSNGVPSCYSPDTESPVTDEEVAAWRRDVAAMARTFEWRASEENFGEPEPAYVQEGLNLFGKHYRDLWW